MRGFSYRTPTLTMDSEKTQKKNRQEETQIVDLVKYVCVKGEARSCGSDHR